MKCFEVFQAKNLFTLYELIIHCRGVSCGVLLLVPYYVSFPIDFGVELSFGVICLIVTFIACNFTGRSIYFRFCIISYNYKNVRNVHIKAAVIDDSYQLNYNAHMSEGKKLFNVFTICFQACFFL